jgi:hypothetical protein
VSHTSLQAANAGVTVRTPWYGKAVLYVALRTTPQAGQGPDVFGAEPWARQIRTHGGRACRLPLKAWLEAFLVGPPIRNAVALPRVAA